MDPKKELFHPIYNDGPPFWGPWVLFRDAEVKLAYGQQLRRFFLFFVDLDFVVIFFLD